MHRRGIVVALSVLLLAGCAQERTGSDREPSATPTPTSVEPTSSGPEPSPTVPVLERLDPAVEATVRAGTGHYAHQIGIGNRPLITYAGDFDLMHHRADATVTGKTPSSGETFTLDNRFVGKRFFVHAESWPAPLRGCWLVVSPDDLARVSDTAAVPGQRLPAALVALGEMEAVSGDPSDEDVVIVTLPTQIALALLAPKLLKGVATAALDSKVSAKVTLSGDYITALEVNGMAVAKHLRTSGVKLSRQQDDALAYLTAHVDYTAPGKSVRLEAPPRSTWMTGAQMDSRQGCRG